MVDIIYANITVFSVIIENTGLYLFCYKGVAKIILLLSYISNMYCYKQQQSTIIQEKGISGC